MARWAQHQDVRYIGRAAPPRDRYPDLLTVLTKWSAGYGGPYGAHSRVPVTLIPVAALRGWPRWRTSPQ
jgi:hypothetical protein